MNMGSEFLNNREEEILEAIVQQFVLTGSPVGSRTLAKRRGFNLSPATIRNVMSDLEEKGYLNHPHTSAGRVPTTKGYRLYVDRLMNFTQLSEDEKKLIATNIVEFSGDVDYILDNTARILAKISSQLGLILTPKFQDGILEKLDIVQVGSEKILVVLSIRDGIAKTILLEVQREISPNALNKVISILNERLSGLRIREIQTTLPDRIRDVSNDDSGIIRLFMDSANLLFDFTRHVDIKYTGTSHIANYPEFSSTEKFSALVELFEEKNMIIHMMEKLSESPGLKVRIGNENEELSVQECSIITAPYTLGHVDGLLGVIGPMRMAYRKIIPLVDYTAKIITEVFQEK
jgi:heat-inducible transcriptional repressor